MFEFYQYARWLLERTWARAHHVCIFHQVLLFLAAVVVGALRFSRSRLAACLRGTSYSIAPKVDGEWERSAVSPSVERRLLKWCCCPADRAVRLRPPQVDTSAAIQVLAEHIGAQDNANVAWLKHTIKTNPKANTLLKAVIVNELLEYPRDIVAITATPSIARALGRAPPKVKS